MNINERQRLESKIDEGMKNVSKRWIETKTLEGYRAWTSTVSNEVFLTPEEIQEYRKLIVKDFEEEYNKIKEKYEQKEKSSTI